MNYDNSDQFTQRVEQIIKNFLHIPNEGIPNLIEFNQKINHLQQQLIDIQLNICQYLKNSFETIKEQLSIDIETIIQQGKNVNSQIHPLKQDEIKVNDKLNQISLKLYEMENNLEKKIGSIDQKMEYVRLNRDEFFEEIKQYDVRMESQWQGLANVSDQLWQLKKQFDSYTEKQPIKKYSLF